MQLMTMAASQASICPGLPASVRRAINVQEVLQTVSLPAELMSAFNSVTHRSEHPLFPTLLPLLENTRQSYVVCSSHPLVPPTICCPPWRKDDSLGAQLWPHCALTEALITSPGSWVED